MPKVKTPVKGGVRKIVKASSATRSTRASKDKNTKVTEKVQNEPKTAYEHLLQKVNEKKENRG